MKGMNRILGNSHLLLKNVEFRTITMKHFPYEHSTK